VRARGRVERSHWSPRGVLPAVLAEPVEEPPAIGAKCFDKLSTNGGWRMAEPVSPVRGEPVGVPLTVCGDASTSSARTGVEESRDASLPFVRSGPSCTDHWREMLRQAQHERGIEDGAYPFLRSYEPGDVPPTVCGKCFDKLSTNGVEEWRDASLQFVVSRSEYHRPFAEMLRQAQHERGLENGGTRLSRS
jgi:hypothetical protein